MRYELKILTSCLFNQENWQPYLVASHNMTGEPKTGDTMFKIMEADKKKMEDTFGIEVVGWCSDDGPDSKKGRRLMGEKYLWMIILVCWAHQINLIVGNVLRVADPLIQVVKIALEIITWFNSHAYALAFLQTKQIITYNKSLAIFLPVLTRWLAHYHTTACLLEIEAAVKTCYVRHQEALIARAGDATKQERAARVFTPIADDSFWKRLHR
jgi:hypothetical protein